MPLPARGCPDVGDVAAGVADIAVAVLSIQLHPATTDSVDSAALWAWFLQDPEAAGFAEATDHAWRIAKLRRNNQRSVPPTT